MFVTVIATEQQSTLERASLTQYDMRASLTQDVILGIFDPSLHVNLTLTKNIQPHR